MNDRNAAHNTGFASGGLKCKIWAVAFQLNFSNKTSFCASISPTSPSPKPLSSKQETSATIEPL
jgi:hypothetical protein